MKKVYIFLLLFLNTIVSAQTPLSPEGLIISNFTGVPMIGSVRLHYRYEKPFPLLGDIPMAIAPNASMMIFNGQSGIPFSGMAPFTSTLYLHGGDYSSTETVADLQTCCSQTYKWWCIKSDVVPQYAYGSDGYIGITRPYDDSMGSYTIVGGMAVLDTDPYEVFRLPDPYYDYNVSYSSYEPGVNNVVVTSSPTPFGGFYMVTVSLN